MDYKEMDKREISQKCREGSHGWIQWKGTDVCIDIHCKNCGARTHFDGDFMYYVTCGECGQIYECNPYIELIPTEKISEDEEGLVGVSK